MSYLLLFPTVYSFTELAEALLSLEGVQFLLSERFNQDPVDIYFGKQRQRGGRSDNPSVNQFLYNAQALHVSKSLIGYCGNIRKRKLEHDFEELCAPLPKKRRPLQPCNT